MQRSPQTVQKIQNGSGVGGDDRLLYQLALRVQHRHRDAVAVDIETDILDAIHWVFLSSGIGYCFSQQPQPTSKGAPFYNACPTLSSAAADDRVGALRQCCQS